jgi:hypothetical protein
MRDAAMEWFLFLLFVLIVVVVDNGFEKSVLDFFHAMHKLRRGMGRSNGRF